jgi:putative glycerol-1-phosphate prenyltransferase
MHRKNIDMNILQKINNSKGEVAVLIDPEKTFKKIQIEKLINKINDSNISFIFVGGSTFKKLKLDPIIKQIKNLSKVPVIIFPGNHTQVSPHADGIFYLSLLTTKNPQFLIDEQIKSTPKIIKSNLEVIPTGYILLDETGKSSTSKITQNTTNKTSKKELLNLSLTAKFLGKKLIIFDKGSGAKNSIQNIDFNKIKEKTNLPIIVGGGVKTTKEIIKLKKLGSNIIIVGNFIEENLDFLDEIKKMNLNIK